jgi:hypothetical protein
MSRSSTLVAAAVAGVGLLLPASALADSPLGSAPSFTMSVGRGTALPLNLGAVGLQNSFNNRFGVTFSQFVVFASIDLNRVTGAIDDEAYGTRLLSLGAGGRYYLGKFKTEKATPYVVAELFSTMPRQDSGDDNADDAVNAISSFGFSPGFGGEYAFAKSFSLSGEVALPIIAASTDEPVDVSATTIAFSSNLFMNFYF